VRGSQPSLTSDLQELRHLTKELLDHIYRFVPQLPFTIRLLAREALLALRIRFPDATQNLIPVVARTVILPFILQAIM
jgi:Ras GTPase-activating-like protein IQGAP2/3